MFSVQCSTFSVQCLQGSNLSCKIRTRGATGSLPDRVPPYPTDDENEQDALEQYVFGDYKNDATNLISSFDSAVRLYLLLSLSKHRYEILCCCKDPEVVRSVERDSVEIEHLGYDVAAVRRDYWSIVADLPQKSWTSRFRNRLNGFGLFARRADAETYLREYRDRGEPDSDSPFDVVYVARVLPRPESKG